MKIFNGFSYKLLRTFSITTAIAGVFLLYMALKAMHGNGAFMMMTLLMFGASIFFGYGSYDAYQHRPVSLQKSEVYGSVCPQCGEMLKVNDKHCANCGSQIK